MDGTDKGNQVAKQEQCQNADVVSTVPEGVCNLLHGIFVNEAFAIVNAPNQNAKHEVCANAGNEEPGTNHQGCNDWTVVHFILKDHHIVNAMGKSCKKGKLQHEYQFCGINAITSAVHKKSGGAQDGNNPTGYVETEGLELSLG